MSLLNPTIQTPADPTVFLLPTTTMEPGGPSLLPASVVTLPGSIMPSDVSSLVGSSFPTTLVMDTESPASPLSSTATATAATIIYTSSAPPSIGTMSSADATGLTQGSSPASNTAGSAAGSAASGHVSTTLTAGAPLDKVSVGRARWCLYEWGRAEAPGRSLLTGFRGVQIGVLGLCLVAGIAARA